MRTFYGDPDEWSPHEDGNPPREGDELCDGHQAHYYWEDGKWQ